MLQKTTACRRVAWALLGLWLVCASAARAAVREASAPIFNHRTQTLLETVQTAGTDLPLSLQTDRDVYLFVTAGAAYTDVRALARPSVPPARLAQALAGATAGTALAGRTVTWSADDYSAALVEAGSGHLLARIAVNTVPVGALVAGLRRAGFMPHTLLRVPRYASGTPLPAHHLHTRNFNWYDQRQVAAIGNVTVRAALSATDIALVCFFLFFVGAAGVAGLAAANRSARDARQPMETRRRRYKAMAQYPVIGAMALHMPFAMVYLRTPHPLTVSDLWFSSSSLMALAPFLAVGPVAVALFLPLCRKSELRLFGPTPGASPIPMPPEEKAVHQRMARWSVAPHLMTGALLLTGIFYLPHNSIYYRVLHPLSYVFIAFGSVIISYLFRKPLSAFTRIAPDADLTWRVRQLGTQMGVRPQEVRVEDSSKAAHFATITTQPGHHILVTRKLLEIMSPDEMEFLLAHQVALMKPRGAGLFWLASLVPAVPVLVIPLLLVLGHGRLIASGLFPYVLLLPLLAVFLMFPMIKVSARQKERQAMAADREAIAVTGNAAAAQSALTKLLLNSPALSGQAGTMNTLPAVGKERMQALLAMAQAPIGVR